MTQLEKLKIMMPDVRNDDLLQLMLEHAETWILAQTGRTELPAGLLPTQLHLAEALYNRRGAAGELSQSEGGISHNYDPDLRDVMKEINRYRLGQVLK